MNPSFRNEEKGLGDMQPTAESIDLDADFGGTAERKRLERNLVWKLDCRMSILLVIYILNYIDRSNAAAARLRGFEADLGLTNQEYDTLLSILFAGYVIMQVPSNMFLNLTRRPSIYIPICMMMWGVISIMTGISRNFVGALLTRFFLGFVEAAFFPGALFLLSKWYTRKELGLRVSLLVSALLISNAFGSLIASGILGGMQGKLGLPAWRWLFFIEGSITTAVAFIAIAILPDFPDNTRWLTPMERSLALCRMAEDGELETKIKNESDSAGSLSQSGEGANGNGQRRDYRCSGLFLAVTDWKVWWFAVALAAEVIALAFNQFFPTLVGTLGFDRTVTLVLAAPPWIVASCVAFFNARHSDRVGERFYHIAVPLLVGILGFILGMSTMNVVARYISLYLTALSFCGYSIILAWVSNCIPYPASKRAVALALINGFSQLGNLAGSYLFPVKWGPSYRRSYGICIALQGLTIAMCYFLRMYLKKLNRQAGQQKFTERETQKREVGFLL